MQPFRWPMCPRHPMQTWQNEDGGRHCDEPGCDWRIDKILTDSLGRPMPYDARGLLAPLEAMTQEAEARKILARRSVAAMQISIYSPPPGQVMRLLQEAEVRQQNKADAELHGELIDRLDTLVILEPDPEPDLSLITRDVARGG